LHGQAETPILVKHLISASYVAGFKEGVTKVGECVRLVPGIRDAGGGDGAGEIAAVVARCWQVAQAQGFAVFNGLLVEDGGAGVVTVVLHPEAECPELGTGVGVVPAIHVEPFKVIGEESQSVVVDPERALVVEPLRCLAVSGAQPLTPEAEAPQDVLSQFRLVGEVLNLGHVLPFSAVQ
jgi:hypothetical protein